MTFHSRLRPLMTAVLGCVGVLDAAAATPLSIRLHPSVPSPQPVGTVIGLAPRIENVSKGLHVFRYSVSVDGGHFRIVRDFSQEREFAWAPDLYEHQAVVRVTVRNNATKDTAEGELPFRFVSRVKGNAPVITPTSHPLVALFSAPPCPEGTQFRVAFRAEGEEAPSRTPQQPCRASSSNNVYVAGMRADAQYWMRPELVSGGAVKTGDWLSFHTGLADGSLPPTSVVVPRAAGGAAVSEPVLIQSARRALATDMQGRVIWYLPYAASLYRVLPGGRFLIQVEGQNTFDDMRRGQVLREVDLAGNTIRETNIGRVAEQLEAHGIHSDCKKDGKECVPGFHHEAIRLPNGHTLAIAGLERMLPAGTQGAKEPVDILGDIVVDLDEDFQVTAVWNAFDDCDLKRASLDNAKCKQGSGRGGCPPIYLAAEANGWTHSNSLNYIPATGDFLISMPEQDWVLKIDWRDGKGSGKVLWRLGKDGDFAANTDDPDPWFSYQHDAGFEPAGSNLLTILDDGHARHKKDPNARNRGQVWKLDEAARTATLVHNADLGVYAVAVGSAQTLKNGGYSFEAGFINPDSVYARAVETDSAGRIVFAIQSEGSIAYRSFRVDDMYSAPRK